MKTCCSIIKFIFGIICDLTLPGAARFVVTELVVILTSVFA